MKTGGKTALDKAAKRRELLEAMMKKEGIKQKVGAEKIPPRAPEAPLVLSFTQQRLWFLERLEPGTSLYNIPMVFRLQGQLDRAALQRALHTLSTHHETLRTTFVEIAGEARPQIAEKVQIVWREEDVTSVPTADRHAHTQQIIEEETRRPFDLSAGPLLRTCLIVQGDEDMTLIFTLHHMISDGWSNGQFLYQLMNLYKSFVEAETQTETQAEPYALPTLPIQYADFAIWQRNWLTGDVLNKQLDYWKNQLTGLPELLELPADRSRPVYPSYKGDTRTLTLPLSLVEQLEALGSSEGATLFMTLLALFQTFLYRYSGQTDLAVGTPIANRTRTEVQNLIGYFANTLVMRTDVSGHPTFRELLRRVREVALGAYAHQDLPFEKLVEELNPTRSVSHNPLYQMMFNLRTQETATIDMPGMQMTLTDLVRGTSKLDLTLIAERSRSEQSLTLLMEYNTDLFDAATIDRMLVHLQRLAESIVAEPEQIISKLPMLTEAEHRQVLVEWNDTAKTYPNGHLLLHQLFEQQVEKTPDAIAVLYQDQTLTYRQLDEQANRLAHALQKAGVRANDKVAVLMERSLEMVIALYGTLKAGAAYLPLDPSHPKDRLVYILEDGEVPVLLTQTHLATNLPPYTGKTFVLDEGSWLHDEPTTPVQVSLSGEHLAYVIYTSGSTGKPKGVLVPHRGIVNRLLWMQDMYQLDATDTVLQKTPYTFDVSVWEFFWPLLTGARLVVAEPGGHQDVAYLIDLIDKQQITTLHFVPSMLQVCLESTNVERCTSLRRVICSGEALPFALQEKFFSRLDAELHNLYGPTEASVDVTYWACQRDDTRTVVPIGRPIANTQMYVLDEHLAPVPIGVAGELHIGGVGLANGYLNRTELTAEKFITSPFQQGERLYKTGDLARFLPDGTIEYLGRLDHQVKIRGLRIELGEIEAALRQHPEVEEAIVMAINEGRDKRLVGYLLVPGDTKPSVGDIRAFLKEKLPEYMIPALYVLLESIPLTANGKVDRKALPKPDTLAANQDREYVAPRNWHEEVLASAWEQVLGTENISIHDNFFEVGGDSILAILVISRAQQLGLHLTVRDMFRCQTIAEQAEVATQVDVQNETTTSAPVIARPRLQRDEAGHYSPSDFPLAKLSQAQLDRIDATIPDLVDIYPVSSSQAYMLQKRLTTADPGMFLIYIQYSLRDVEINVTAFENAWQAVLNRHDALRTAFFWEGVDIPLQVVRAQSPLNFHLEELRAKPEQEQNEAIDAYLRRENENNFDLQGDHLKIALFHTGERAYEFVLLYNYMVLDGWGSRLLIKDFMTCYAAFAQGTPLELAEPQHPYRNFIAWQQAQDMPAAKAFWQQQLAGITHPTPLVQPTAVDVAADLPWEYQKARSYFPPEMATRLKEYARRHHLTLNNVVTGVWALLLSAYTGADHVVFGMTFSGRPGTLPEAREILGATVSILPMPVRVQHDASLQTWFQDIQLLQTEINQFDYTSLKDIHDWTAIPFEEGMFQSYLVFQNNPRDPQMLDTQRDLLGVAQNGILSQLVYPLRVEVTPGEFIGLSLTYDPRAFSAARVEQFMQGIRSLLEQVEAAQVATVGDLLATLAVFN